MQHTTLENKHNNMLKEINDIDIDKYCNELEQLKKSLEEKMKWNEKFEMFFAQWHENGR